MAFEGLMKGKRGLIMGVANERSIAWGIAQTLSEAGAELAFTYQGDAFKKRVLPLVENLKPAVVADCDVTNQGSLDALFADIKRVWGELDFVVHAVAFSDKDQLKGRYVDTTAENFAMTMNISCYSFTAVAQRAEKLMTKGGSMRHPHLLRRRKSDAALQCDGRGQSGAGSQRALYGRRPRQESHPREFDFRRARSRRWPPRASAISAIS